MRAKQPTSLALAAGIAALAAGAAARADQAETGAEEVETIVVTGSRIQRKDFVSPSPIVTVGSEAIENAGRVTVDDYLRDLPQFTAGTGGYSNDSNGGTAGRATLNLRGLGSQRNLVILDGRRMMPSGTDGAIDINTIPAIAIAGIEVISGGASATYGSDALAGVVNFKTRGDLDGLEMRAGYTSLDRVGEDSWQVGAAYGSKLSDGRGELLLSAEYVDRGGTRQNERAFFLNPPISSFTVYGRSRIGASFLGVNDDGTIFDQGTGAGYRGSSELPFLRDANGAVGFHGAFDNYLQVPLERLSLFGKLDHEIGNTELYARASYTQSTAYNVGAAPNVAGAPWEVIIPAANPFLVALRAANPGRFGAGPVTVYQARISQAGSRVYETDNDTWQALLGSTGRIGDRDLNWDVHASYGRAENVDRTTSGAASVSALQRLLNAADGGNSICAGGYNPFGGTDPLSPACLAYVSRLPRNETTLTQSVLEASLEGRAFAMPAGDARFAVSAQHRQNEYDFVPDPDIATGDLANLSASLPTSGKIRALEAGVELFLPLLRDAAFAQEVNLTAGYRYSDYNLAGSADTFKVEFDARIVEPLLLRGSYQRAVRAPNVGEFFLAGESRVVVIGNPPTAGDPCDQRNNPTGARLSLCQAQAVAANYRAPAASTPAVTRGNRNLDPETADSFTAGFVLDLPLGTPRLQFSADYYSIEIEDAIAPISAADSLQQCYNVGGAATGFDPVAWLASNPFCRNFARTAPGTLLPIDQPILNLGGLKTRGLDVAVNLAIPVDAIAWRGQGGSVTVSTNVNKLLAYESNTFADSPVLDYAGTVSIVTAESFPEWKAVTQLAVETGPLTLIGSWRYISSMRDRSVVFNPASTTPGPPAYDYFDLTARLAVGESLELSAVVTNLTDEDPPIVGGAAANTNFGTYDVLGRTFFVGARFRF